MSGLLSVRGVVLAGAVGFVVCAVVVSVGLTAAARAATPSTDYTPPISTITSPAPGATLADGSLVAITGTALDLGGGVVAGVEVSTDGGVTWHPVTAMSAANTSVVWSYSWVVNGSGGPTTIESRATDNSGNVEFPGPGVTVNVNCPCSPDLSITNSAPSSVVSGNTLTYTITATNSGGQDATGVTVTDRFSGNENLNLVSASTTLGTCSTKAGTVMCSVGTLSGGRSATITIVAIATKPGMFINKASVTATNVPADPVGSNDDSSPATTTVIGT